MTTKKNREQVGLPPRIFFYTPDQIATLFELDVQYVMQTLLFYEKREPGIVPRNKLRAINIAPEGEAPVWRVAESNLIAYLKAKGIRFYERGYFA
jgi:hypothetical protein